MLDKKTSSVLRASLYCILFGFVTFVRLRSRGPAQWRSPRRPVGLASRVLLRRTAACISASPCDRSIDCCELGRTRHARYKMAGILRIQAPAEVAHSHGMYRRPSTKRRAPGSWCDWGGLSHSGDPHTTMYRLTLPSVEHAGCAGLHTRQSRTGLATEETAAIRAMVQAQAHAASTQQRLGGRIFRAARRAGGRWLARGAAR